MSEDALVALILQGGVPVIAMLLLIVWWGNRGVWVWGKTHEEALAREREATARERLQAELEHQRAMEWQQIALDALGVAEVATRERGRSRG